MVKAARGAIPGRDDKRRRQHRHREGPVLNKVMIIGNLGRDPEQRSTSSGMAVTEFSVAVNSRRKNEDHTEWFNVKLFDKQAENAATFLRKGRKGLGAGIRGSLARSTTAAGFQQCLLDNQVVLAAEV